MLNVQTNSNAARLDQLQKAWAEILVKTLRRGFYGTIQIEVAIQDGSIQCFRKKIEQIEK
jgi:hypothetical protein